MINPPAENILSGNNDETGFIDTGDFGYFPPLGMLYVASYLEEHTERVVLIVHGDIRSVWCSRPFRRGYSLTVVSLLLRGEVSRLAPFKVQRELRVSVPVARRALRYSV